MNKRSIFVAVAVAGMLGCTTSPEAIRREMGAQDRNPPSIAKTGDHPDKYVNILMDGFIQAATRLHFASDGSRCDAGDLKVTAQWKNSPVVLRFHFTQEPNGMVNYTYMRECNGNVLVDQGDAKALELLLETVDQVMAERDRALSGANQPQPTSAGDVATRAAPEK
jgi:hypothetical protein